MIQRIPLNLIERLSDPRANRAASAPGPDMPGDAASVEEAGTPGAESAEAAGLRTSDGARVRGSFAEVMSRDSARSAKARRTAAEGADRARAERTEAAADAVIQAASFAGPPPTIVAVMPAPVPAVAAQDSGVDRSAMPEGTPGGVRTSSEGDEALRQASIPAAPFDLPTFLRVLPATGPEVAVAAAREPAMAEAVQRLARASATSLPPSSPGEAASTRSAIASMPRQPEAALPDFLVQGAGADPARTSSPDRAPATLASATPLAEGRSVALPAVMGAYVGDRPAVSVDGRARAASASRGELAARERTSRPAASSLDLTGSTSALRTTPDPLNALLAATPSFAGRIDRSARPLDARSTTGTPPVPVSADAASASMAALDDLASSDPSAASALRQPVGTDAWQDELSAQLAVMAEQGERSEAVMKLAPEGLGELEIRVEVQGVEASLQFGAANAEARQALELAQSRLRELMAGQGLKVSDFNVFSSLHGNPQTGGNNRGDHRSGQGAAVPSAEAVGELRAVVAPRRSAGVLDLYA
jgi:flagellar hook-length control protein FliK